MLETKVADLRTDFANIESKLDRMTDRLEANGKLLAGYVTYNRILWPVVTVLVAVISWLVGTHF